MRQKRISSRAKLEKINCCCVTARQWALLLSTLIFIITAVLTTCAILANIHSKEVLDVLSDDIREEHENQFASSKTNDGKTSSNESLLCLSVDHVFVTTKVMSICMWVSWINLLCAGVLIYGVVARMFIYMMPWLCVSVLTYVGAITFLFSAYFRFISGFYVSYCVLVITCASGMVFGLMWYGIFFYYIVLNPPQILLPKRYQAYGGYVHTVQPPVQKKIPKV